jgi:mono/diheme cytochrome c family protein
LEQKIKQGEIIYQDFCAVCHGRDARGNGPAASELKTTTPSLRQVAKRHGGQFNPDKVRAFIDGRDMPRSHGTIQMPIWGNLFRYVAEVSDNLTSDTKSTEQHAQARIQMLVEYLKSIQEK